MWSSIIFISLGLFTLSAQVGAAFPTPNVVLETGTSKIPLFQSTIDFLRRTSISENVFNIDLTSLGILLMLKIIIGLVFLGSMISGRRTSCPGGRSISSSHSKTSLTQESEVEWTGDTCFIMYSLGYLDKLGCVAR